MRGGGNILILLALVFAAFLSDLKFRKIPNIITVGGSILGLLFTIWSSAPWLIARRIVTAITVFAILYVFFKIGALGAGDIKLLMMISMYVNTADYIKIFVFSFAVAAVMALYKIARSFIIHKRIVMYENGDNTKRLAIPLACAIFGGSCIWAISTII